MDKATFLNELRKRLSFLPKEELDKTILYYSEMISDRMDAGMSEEDAVKAVGNIDDIVDSVKSYTCYTPPPQNINNTGGIINKIIGYAGIIALCFGMVWLISSAIGLAFAVITCIIAAIIAAVKFGIALLLTFIGFALIFLALFLATIPLCSYCKYGIAYFKKLAGG